MTSISEYPKLIGGCQNENKDKKVEQTNWAPEHSELLRELVARDLSYAEIANAINAKFRTCYSRNAAIGRAKRMGITESGPGEAAAASAPAAAGQDTGAPSVRIQSVLGADGSALVHEVLILGMTMEQVGLRRGLRSQRWKDYFARRFCECLDRLALIYGFATEKRS